MSLLVNDVVFLWELEIRMFDANHLHNFVHILTDHNNTVI
jgi:hypothetical protein